jgi:hypothetical protein
MIELLSRGSHEDWDRLRTVVEQALSLGCQDVAAIRHLLAGGQLTKPAVAVLESGLLARDEWLQPVLSDYDRLLEKGQA